MYQMCGVFAEFERSMIQERIKAGLARTKKPLGRPRTVTPEKEAAVHAARADGKSIRHIASEFGIGRGTVERIAKRRS